MFRDAEYVKWANEQTIHVLAYSIDPDGDPPPLEKVERDGETVEVLREYPMFTPNETDMMRSEIARTLKISPDTPWCAVVAGDGSTVLAEAGKGTGKWRAKEFRALYEEPQKKLGAVLPRDAWKKARAALQASTDAEFDERWADAVKSVLEARAAVKDPPKPLAERISARSDGLRSAATDRIAAAEAVKDEKTARALREALAPLLAPPAK